jgi:hypothetical protein
MGHMNKSQSNRTHRINAKDLARTPSVFQKSDSEQVETNKHVSAKHTSRTSTKD